MNDSKFNIAVLIDGDNVQAKLIKELFAEVSKYGESYDKKNLWRLESIPQMNSWKEVINQHSINPIQNFLTQLGKTLY